MTTHLQNAGEFASITPFINYAITDLANRKDVNAGQIEVVDVDFKVWPNAGLGCPEPGKVYTQATVKGYLIKLKIVDSVYFYHGQKGKKPFLCEAGERQT